MLSTEAGHPELPDSDWSVSIEAVSAESTEVCSESVGDASGDGVTLEVAIETNLDCSAFGACSWDNETARRTAFVRLTNLLENCIV